MLIVSGLVMVLLVAAFAFLNIRFKWLLLNPALWFLVAQARMSLGMLPYLDPSRSDDQLHLLAMVGVMGFFVVGTMIMSSLIRFPQEQIDQWDQQPVLVERGPLMDTMITILIIISVVISILYYYAVGYILFLEGVRALLHGQALDDPASLRLYAYSSGKYFAPGYVNQFKNTLLPVLVAYIMVRGLLDRNRREVLIAAILVPICVVFLLGTGQRGAFCLSAFFAVLFVASAVPWAKSRAILPVIAVSTVLLFGVASLITGRGAAAVNDKSDLVHLARELPSRVFQQNQVCGAVGFRLVCERPTTWGHQWLRSITQMVPGLKDPDYLSIDAEIFALFYNSYRGTAPLSLVGSLWYNFGVLGVTLFPLLLGLFFQYLYYRLFLGPKMLFRLAIFSVVCTLVVSWGSGGINTLFNYGLPAVVLLWVVARWTRARGVTLYAYETDSAY